MNMIANTTDIGADDMAEKLVFKFDGIGVDSGLIMIGDASFADENMAKDAMNLIKIVAVKNGTYKATLKIKKSWNGSVETRGIVEITDGKLIIGDPGYYIANWDMYISKFVDDGKLKEDAIKIAKIMIANNMGGDGVYDCILELEPLNK